MHGINEKYLQILVGKPERRIPRGRPSLAAEGRIILKWILKK
jgi:hypothetical protein